MSFNVSQSKLRGSDDQNAFLKDVQRATQDAAIVAAAKAAMTCVGGDLAVSVSGHLASDGTGNVTITVATVRQDLGLGVSESATAGEASPPQTEGAPSA